MPSYKDNVTLIEGGVPTPRNGFATFSRDLAMTQLPQLNQLPVEPLYSQDTPSAPIGFGSIKVEFHHNGQLQAKTENAVLRFLPSDRLSFVIPDRGGSTFEAFKLALDRWQGKLRLGNSGASVDAMLGAVGSEYGGINLLPMTSGVTVTASTDSIVETRFHLFNFPDFSGSDDFVLTIGQPPKQGAARLGRIVLRSDGWVVTIAAIRETSSRVKALKAQGGYIITHVASIERENRSSYTSHELDDLLNCLQYFLSFALGRWAGLALPVGFDAGGNRVFEQWGLRKTAEGSWKSSCAWFDEHHAELLPQVFPGFRDLWKSKLWHRALIDALYWYCQANDRGRGIGVDAGLILAQTALELLAWTLCVKDKKIVSDVAFKRRGLSAADKLRLLAFAIGVPTDIPAQLTALHKKAGSNWSDAMHAITGIRNSLIHPDVLIQIPDDSYYDAWRLSLWYTELTLLRLCGHNGKYANRLVERWIGQIEAVPWVDNGQSATKPTTV